MNKLLTWYQNFKKQWHEARELQVLRPSYRLIDISMDENDNYIARIQIISKSITFNSSPEEILASNEMVDQFSPRDIRTLTYLGYLGINSPKYKILAQRLSQNDQVVFALKKRGSDESVVKTADEIMKDNDVLKALASEDAHLVGYTAASDQYKLEQKQKEALKKQQAPS
jgi:hypothetical protein